MAIKVSGTEVISDSRALNNIATVDATTAAAISAAGVGGGGTVDFTASGSLSNGDLVKINSDGTVSVVEGGGVGSATVFESAQSEYISATFDSNSNKVVIAYRDSGNSSYGTAVVGTVSGSSISFGTPVVFESANSSETSATFDSNSNKVVIAYRYFDGSSSFEGRAIVGTVSGTSISFGTDVVFNSANTEYVSATFDSASNKVVIAYQNGGNSSYGTAVVGTVSGTSISFGTPVVFESASTLHISATFDSNSNKVVIAYSDGGQFEYGKGVVGTVSGTSISFGTEVLFELGSAEEISATFDSNSNKVVIAYKDGTNSNYGTAVVGTVSGTSISFGTPVVFESATTNNISAVFDSNSNKVVIAYRDDGNSIYGTIILGTVIGTSISFDTPVVFSSVSSSEPQAVFDSNSNKVVIAYRDNSTTYGNARTYSITDVENWVGFASADATDGNTTTINVVSSVNEGQSGLTIGSKYYLPDSGTLSTTAIDGREVGRAIAADKILITQGSVS